MVSISLVFILRKRKYTIYMCVCVYAYISTYVYGCLNLPSYTSVHREREGERIFSDHDGIKLENHT